MAGRRRAAADGGGRAARSWPASIRTFTVGICAIVAAAILRGAARLRHPLSREGHMMNLGFGLVCTVFGVGYLSGWIFNTLFTAVEVVTIFSGFAARRFPGGASGPLLVYVAWLVGAILWWGRPIPVFLGTAALLGLFFGLRKWYLASSLFALAAGYSLFTLGGILALLASFVSGCLFNELFFALTGMTDEIHESANPPKPKAPPEPEGETSEAEIGRVLRCETHYDVLGVQRRPDLTDVKKAYRRKSMMVHPDKNRNNEDAVEAFKALQNAYEVLQDEEKRREYDGELATAELRAAMERQAQGTAPWAGAGAPSDERPGGVPVRCSTCNSVHNWYEAGRAKSRARWCGDCRVFHAAKDGDGWAERHPRPMLWGYASTQGETVAYACQDGVVYECTEWVACQGLSMHVNTHRAAFHVNTPPPEKGGKGRGKGRGGRGGGGGGGTEGGGVPFTDADFELFEEAARLAQQMAEEAAMGGGGFGPPPPGYGGGGGGGGGRGRAGGARGSKAPPSSARPGKKKKGGRK